MCVPVACCHAMSEKRDGLKSVWIAVHRDNCPTETFCRTELTVGLND